MEESLLPEKLRTEMSERASDLLVAFVDESSSENFTEIEKEFMDTVLCISQISKPYKYLADSYIMMYQYVKEEKNKVNEDARNS